MGGDALGGKLLGTGKRPSSLSGVEPTIGPQRSVASRTVSGPFSLATESSASVKSLRLPKKKDFFFLCWDVSHILEFYGVGSPTRMLVLT